MSAITKTVIITGAGSGIGFAVANAFVREGSHVVLNGRHEDKLIRAAAQSAYPERLAIVAGDVTRTWCGAEMTLWPISRKVNPSKETS